MPLTPAPPPALKARLRHDCARDCALVDARHAAFPVDEARWRPALTPVSTQFWDVSGVLLTHTLHTDVASSLAT